MILITVGTTMPFDELLQEADRLAGAGLLNGPIVCQGGHSKYRMKHAEQFFARPSITDLIATSSLVICHGGGATVLQLLTARKPFVAFPNPRGAGDHQTLFLKHASLLSEISWSSDVSDMLQLVRVRQAHGPATTIRAGIPRVGDLLLQSR